MDKYEFSEPVRYGLVVIAGGFEDRATSFIRRVRRSSFSCEAGILLRYESQRLDNEPNFLFARERLSSIIDHKDVEVVPVSAELPVQSCDQIRIAVSELAPRLEEKTAIVDISGMTHLWALNSIHACVTAGIRVDVVYTEARSYHPVRADWNILKRALASGDDEVVYQALQSASLKAVHILPTFSGNFRPGRSTCLIIFAGYEPNRLQGLVDDYAPGSLIVLFGKSPHQKHGWRTQLSKDLHQKLFYAWYKREDEVSTIDVKTILDTLEREFAVISDTFDIAVAPHCSKMQGLATYLFWRRHPEVQLVFTSPVKFHKDSYSHGAEQTFIYRMTDC